MQTCVAAPDTILRWTVHLAPEHPGKLVCSLGVITLACFAAYYALGPLGSVVVAAALVASLAEFLFPIRYEITSDRAVCKMLLKKAEIEWRTVRRCYVDDAGVKLSPLDRLSRMEAFRGVYLRFAGNREQVIDAVQRTRKHPSF